MRGKHNRLIRRSVACACVCVCVGGLYAAAWAGQNDGDTALHTTVGDAMRQMHLPHVAVPYGVPPSYSWRLTPVVERGAGPPKDFHAITGWGQIFRADGSAPVGFRVALRNLRTYVETASGKLELVQESSSMDGGQFRPDYKDNLATAAEITHDDAGNTVVRTKPSAVFHFWPSAGKVNIDPRSVRGVLVAVEARIEPEPGQSERDVGKHLMLSTGADYWLAQNSSWDRYLTNVGIGMGRFSYIGTQWKCFTMTTIKGGNPAMLSTPILC